MRAHDNLNNDLQSNKIGPMNTPIDPLALDYRNIVYKINSCNREIVNLESEKYKLLSSLSDLSNANKVIMEKHLKEIDSVREKKLKIEQELVLLEKAHKEFKECSNKEIERLVNVRDGRKREIYSLEEKISGLTKNLPDAERLNKDILFLVEKKKQLEVSNFELIKKNNNLIEFSVELDKREKELNNRKMDIEVMEVRIKPKYLKIYEQLKNGSLQK
jgi:uncharacterized protein (DUF3084 family)